jgi:hypothetical protein
LAITAVLSGAAAVAAVGSAEAVASATAMAAARVNAIIRSLPVLGSCKERQTGGPVALTGALVLRTRRSFKE